MCFNIAGIPLTIAGDVPSGVYDLMSGYTSSYAEGVAMHVGSVKEISPVELDRLYGVKPPDMRYGMLGDVPVMRFCRGKNVYAEAEYSGDFSKVRIRAVDVEPLGGFAWEKWLRLLLGWCFQSCVPSWGGVTYHGSCIKYKDRAILVCAPSGTGKSTHTGLWKKYYPEDVTYINDDTPILMERDGAICAFGSPWAGTSGINNSIYAPLRAAVYIERSSENALRRMDERESVLYAMRSVRGQYFPAQRERQTRFIFELARRVPFYKLSCDISRNAVDTLKSCLF